MTKICPLRLIADKDNASCVRNVCAWWDTEDCCCSLIGISCNLTGIYRSLSD